MEFLLQSNGLSSATDAWSKSPVMKRWGRLNSFTAARLTADSASAQHSDINDWWVIYSCEGVDYYFEQFSLFYTLFNFIFSFQAAIIYIPMFYTTPCIRPLNVARLKCCPTCLPWKDFLTSPHPFPSKIAKMKWRIFLLADIIGYSDFLFFQEITQ